MKQWEDDVSFMKEKKITDKHLVHYNDFYQNNIKDNMIVTIGIDEVGVSPIAGPMVASIIALPKNHQLSFLPIDSKRLNDVLIEKYAKQILDKAVYVRLIGYEAMHIYEEKNLIHMTKKIWQALYVSMYDDITNSSVTIEEFVVDGSRKSKYMHYPTYKAHADNTHDAVSAAAIVAKYFTNVYMQVLDMKYPMYQFAKHKGYTTYEHIQAIKEHGLTTYHRKIMTENKLTEKLINPANFFLLDDSIVQQYVFLISLYYELYPNRQNEFIKTFLPKFKQTSTHRYPKMHYHLDRMYKEICSNNKQNKYIERFLELVPKINWSYVYPLTYEIQKENFNGYLYLYHYQKYKPLDFEIVNQPIECYLDMLYVLEKIAQYLQYFTPYENKELESILDKNVSLIQGMEEGKDKDFLRMIYLQIKNHHYCSNTQCNKTHQIIANLIVNKEKQCN